MRIIGGHDYYDRGLAYGVDPDVVFVRKAIIKKKDFLPTPDLRLSVYANNDSSWRRDYFSAKYRITLRPIIIYLAGIKYTGMQVYLETTTQDYAITQSLRSFWSYEELERYLNSYKATVKTNYKSLEDISSFFKETGSTKEQQFCINNRIVVATLQWKHSESEWKINGDNLKDYAFYRVLDHYRCYQEIAMYVGGVLPKEGAPLVEISDKSKIKKHGFDKYSFRKGGNVK